MPTLIGILPEVWLERERISSALALLEGRGHV